MLFIYQVEPPWFIGRSDSGRVSGRTGESMYDEGLFVEAVVMLRSAIEMLQE